MALMAMVMVVTLLLAFGLVIGGLMWAFPLMPLAYPPLHRPGWGRRLLGGNMTINQTLTLGVAGLALLWWLAAAGVLTAPAGQGAVLLLLMPAWGVALFNAGRRAQLPAWGCLALGVMLAAGWLPGLVWAVSLLMAGDHVVH